ncbi:MAG: hypothetical protein ACYDDS_08675 [Candidatus Sulfotelmatobacter sp.]
MQFLPQSQPATRARRVHFVEHPPAVLRLADGRRVSGRLKVVSLTGGLLSVAHPVDPGRMAKLMFLTAAGLVLGSAEMLPPLSWGLQPFRFIALAYDDEDKLKITIQRSVDQSRSDHVQIERSRAW